MSPTLTPQLEFRAYLGNVPVSGHSPGLGEEAGPQMQKEKERERTTKTEDKGFTEQMEGKQKGGRQVG